MTTETEPRNRRMTKEERTAQHRAMTGHAPALTATATEQQSAMPAEMTPLDAIQQAIDDLPETEMASWVIDIFCQAAAAPQYRPIFRAAAEQRGEAGVYRLEQLLIRNCNPRNYHAICLAAATSVAGARASKRGILTGDMALTALPASVIVKKVAQAAKKGCRLAELDGTAAPIFEDRDA